jgi:hypothetical protein
MAGAAGGLAGAWAGAAGVPAGAWARAAGRRALTSGWAWRASPAWAWLATMVVMETGTTPITVLAILVLTTVLAIVILLTATGVLATEYRFGEIA